MSFVETMKSKAKDYRNRLVLPEATEERTLRAARALSDAQMVSELFLIGNKAAVAAAAEKAGIGLTGLTVIDPAQSEWLGDFANTLYEKRKAKGMTPEQAKNRYGRPAPFRGHDAGKRKSRCNGCRSGKYNSRCAAGRINHYRHKTRR